SPPTSVIPALVAGTHASASCAAACGTPTVQAADVGDAALWVPGIKPGMTDEIGFSQHRTLSSSPVGAEQLRRIQQGNTFTLEQTMLALLGRFGHSLAHGSAGPRAQETLDGLNAFQGASPLRRSSSGRVPHLPAAARWLRAGSDQASRG